MESNENVCEKCVKLNEKRMEIYIKAQEESRKYNNTVISLGYAAILFIFSNTKNLPLIVVKSFGFFFIISIAFFIINEIHKSFIVQKREKAFSDSLDVKRDYIESLKVWFDKNKEENEKFDKFWPFYFNISLISGIIATLILLLSIFWPTFTEKIITFLLIPLRWIYKVVLPLILII